MSFADYTEVKMAKPGEAMRIDLMDKPVETRKTIQSQVSRVFGSLMECRRHHEEISGHMVGVVNSDNENEPQNFMELLEVVALLAEKEESNMRGLKDMIF